MSEINESIEKQLSEFIITKFLESSNPTIAGSDLGVSIQENFPDLDIKAQYQGLTSFLNQYCSEEIIQIGKHGGDNLFTHKQRRNEDNSFKQQNAWAAFSNPRLDVQLFANPTTPSLQVLSPGQEAPDSFEKIERMSESNYRKIAEEFVKSELTDEDEEKSQTLMDIIAKETFWFEFVSNIKTLFGEQYKEQLLSFRVKRINQIFKKRLEEIGMTDVEAQKIISGTLKTKKEVTRKNIVPSLSTQKLRNTPSNQNKFVTNELVHNAIDLMSQNDLRQVWLPLGAIMDALKK